MISRAATNGSPLEKDALLIVGGRFDGGSEWIADLRARYPEWSIATCDTYLSGIVEAARKPLRAILACVDPSLTQLDNAVAGLREAAGPHTKLVLCCTPESEPIARKVVAGGADDYVLYPPGLDELDTAIGYARSRRWRAPALTPAPAASTEELVRLSEMLADLGARPIVLIEKLAALIRTALSTRGATVIVEGAVASSGEAVTKPVLAAPLTGAGGVIGQLTVGERLDGAYTPVDAEKLKHYATMAGHILQAASMQRQWRQTAVTDECSGLPNRRYLRERLDDILTRAAAEHFPVTLLLFDVDDFKAYNDQFGHDAGDEIIRVTGELFRKHCREQDVVARYGGDEFVVVFWDAEGPRVAGSRHPDCALAVLDRVKEALRCGTDFPRGIDSPFGTDFPVGRRAPILGPSGEGRLTISGGLATYPWDASSPEDLLKRADEALLAAKRAGKNRIYLIGQAKSGSA